MLPRYKAMQHWILIIQATDMAPLFETIVQMSRHRKWIQGPFQMQIIPWIIPVTWGLLVLVVFRGVR